MTAYEYSQLQNMLTDIQNRKPEYLSCKYQEGYETAILKMKSMVHSFYNSHKTADVEPVRYGDWILKAKHYFNDYGYCEVYVDASCSECGRKWHGDRIVIGKILFDYDNNDMPDPITEKRIKECKEYCLQEAGKFMLTESPFCEKCGAKMDGKEE